MTGVKRQALEAFFDSAIMCIFWSDPGGAGDCQGYTISPRPVWPVLQSTEETRGAWTDCYHSTLIQDGGYLRRCIFCMAFNMVRAGAAGIQAIGSTLVSMT